MPEQQITRTRWPRPALNHVKTAPYTEFPLVYNDTVTNEPFFVGFPFLIATSTLANTTLYKWNGNSWTEVSGWANPDIIDGRGYFSVTTSADEYVLITEIFE